MVKARPRENAISRREIDMCLRINNFCKRDSKGLTNGFKDD